MRSRITITISSDLLNQVDHHIDGLHIRNRSQAIEHLVEQSLSPSISTAVILAGGPGTKLTGFPNLPSALITIDHEPLLIHTLRLLKLHHFTKIIICAHKKDSSLKKIASSSEFSSLEIIFSLETSHLGTGGALKRAAHLIGDQPFLLIHSDVLTNVNLDKFKEFFTSQDSLACVAIKPRPGKISYGKVFLQGNTVVDFQEPQIETPVSLINTGIYLMNHQCLSLLPRRKHFNLEKTLIPSLIKNNQLSAYTFQGLWFDVTNDQDYQEASKRWQQSKTSSTQSKD